MSLTMVAHFNPWSFDWRIYDRRVVLPLPRNPLRSVTGSRFGCVTSDADISMSSGGQVNHQS